MINLTLFVTDKETQQINEYEAGMEPEESTVVFLKDDVKKQKFNALIDIIAYGDYSLEVSYNGKVANATYEVEHGCIVISEDSKKRLLAQTKKMKK